MKKGIQYKGRQTTQHESWIVGDLVTVKNGDYKIWTGKGAYSVRQDSIERVDDDWISIEDMLPKKGMYLVFVDNYNGIIEQAFFDGNFWLNPDDMEIYFSPEYITHWQPLPKSPKKL